MAQYTYPDFINVNSAPKGAHHIGVYNSAGKKVGEIPLGNLSRNNNDEPIYKFGVLSDIHLDTTDYNYSQYLNTYPYSDEGEGDFKRAVKWLLEKEGVDMFCSCGDLSQNGTASEFSMPKNVIDTYLPTTLGIPFYTCTGNHDVKTAGGNGFGTYFLRSLEQTWNGMFDFERSSAFNESFCFSKNCGSRVDHFIFLSMYSYSLGPSASPYQDSDLQWLKTKLESWKNERVFIFTHLFFPDYAGNLGRVNGSGGIYPSGNWLGGSQLTTLTEMLARYKNALWFSGHSHWKWQLQKHQHNVTIDRYNEGAWTVHIPSLALPIDSDYSTTSSETEKSREEKPLESQGGVVYVYEDRIEIRGIDFNVNTSENGVNQQGYSGDTYVRYLPIANYTMETILKTIADEGEIIGPEQKMEVDNIKINISGNRGSITGQTITADENGVITIEFTNASESCVLTHDTLSPTDRGFHVHYDDVQVQLINVQTSAITNVPITQIDNYFGWLSDVGEDNGTTYSFENDFDYRYNINEYYSGYTYGSTELETFLGVQLNASSKLGSSTNPCWLDNYVNATDRNTFNSQTQSNFHIRVMFTNLSIAPIKTEIVDVDYEPYTYSELTSINVDEPMTVIMVNPNKNDGYILGHNGTTPISIGDGFTTVQNLSENVSNVIDNNNYHMVITKKQDVRTEQTVVEHPRTFTVTNGNKASITTDFVKTTSSISGYDLYTLTTSFNGKNNGNQTNTATAVIDFDGMEFPRTVYIKLYYKSTNGSTSTFTLNGTQATKGTNNTLTSLSNFTSVQITGGVTNGSISLTNSSRSSKTSVSFSVYVLVPNNIVETETITTEVTDGEPYYTLNSQNGNKTPIGTNGLVSWGNTPIKLSIENVNDLISSVNLTKNVSLTNNDKLIAFKNEGNNYLNAGGGLSSLSYSNVKDEHSVWYLYGIDVVSNNDYIRKSNFETNTSKGSPSVDDFIQDLDNGYVAVSFNTTSQGFWVSPPNMVGGKQPTLIVDDLKVYSGLNVITGTPISLPSNVGFYDATTHTGTDRYQIATNFQPSYTETNANNRLQFQTSSSYVGGNITIVMKIRFTYPS